MGFISDLRLSTMLTGALVAGLALGLGVQTIRLEGLTIAPKAGAFHFTLLDIPGWRPRALDAEAALAKVADASKAAQSAQATTNHQPAITTATIARQADAQTPDYLRRVAALSAAHAGDAGRLCGPSDNQGGAGRADLPGTDHPAQGDDGKAGSAEMVSVPRSDWERITREAALRAELYQVGQEWIAQGVAKVSADEAPAQGGH